MDRPLYADERSLMWSRINGFRRTADLQALLNEKAAAITIAQFIIDTRVLDQFREAGPEALGTHEGAETAAPAANEKGTDVGTRTNAQAVDVSSRSAPWAVRTSNEAVTSFISSGDLVDAADGGVP